MQKTYSRYVRFNGRAQDDDVDFDENISVLIPAAPESTNVLLFQLVLLQSETIDRDYVVGWGVFPLLNSDFQLNEGKFKVPLLFGNVNPSIDKFKRLEKMMMHDLDSWLANCYFELEKVNLMDIKVEEKTKKLFYKPVSGLTPQEQQQLLKMHQHDKREIAQMQDAREVLSSAQSERQAQEEQTDSDSDSDDSDEDHDESKEAEAFAEKYTEILYHHERSQEDINYDHFHVSVAQKYDLTTRRLTFKKIKYISDEILLDLRWRQWHTI